MRTVIIAAATFLTGVVATIATFTYFTPTEVYVSLPGPQIVETEITPWTTRYLIPFGQVDAFARVMYQRGALNVWICPRFSLYSVQYKDQNDIPIGGTLYHYRSVGFEQGRIEYWCARPANT